MSSILVLRPRLSISSLLHDPFSGTLHSTIGSHTNAASKLYYKPQSLTSELPAAYKIMNNSQSIKYILHQLTPFDSSSSLTMTYKSSIKPFSDHLSHPSVPRPFRYSSHTSFPYDLTGKRLSRTGAAPYSRVFFTSLTSSAPPGGSTGGIFPYSDTDNLDFNRCKNPAQLEKSIASYLVSHPEPAERALVAMLVACANLIRAIASSPDREQRNRSIHGHSQVKGQRKGKSKVAPQETTAGDFKSNLLQTILGSFQFTSDDVFKIAYSVYYDIPAGLYPDKERSNIRIGTKPSLEVTNAFLHVCAISGHFDQAWLIMKDMTHRAQGDVVPDLTTYLYVLKAAAIQRQKLSSQSLDVTEINAKIENIIDSAADSLSRQARIAFWMKLGLGGLVGATVGKFTMMGIMALPSSGIFNGATESMEGEQSMSLNLSQPGEGIIHFLASQEIALGVGLGVGLLTAGYYIHGSTRKSRVDTGLESVSKSRNHYLREDIPRARLFGLYFPDLKTTNKEEIREYLRKNAEL